MANLQERWGEIRARGRWRFISRYGVLGWGLGTGVLFSAIFWIFTGRATSYPTILLMSLILFPIGGIAWGALMWSFGERSWRRVNGDGPER